MDLKGQQAVSAVLISGILIGVVGSVYFWGVPLIQKSRDATVLENAEALMFLIDQKIKTVSSAGGRENIKLFEPGLLSFSGEGITYSVSTDGTIYASDANIPLGKTTNCDDAKAGIFGSEESTVLCVTSTQLTDAKYQNVYSLSYRNLTSDLKTYRIMLSGPDSIAGEGGSIIIQTNGITETVQQGKQIVTVDIGITIS